MLNHRIHFIDATLVICAILLQIDGFLPLKINVQLNEMSLLSVPELFQMKNRNDRCLFDISFKQMLFEFAFLTLHFYIFWFFPQINAAVESYGLVEHFLFCSYGLNIYLNLIAVLIVILFYLNPVNIKCKSFLLTNPI